MVRDLLSHLQRHEGRTAYLYGKHKSILTADLEAHRRSGNIRVAVNDTAAVLEEVHYVFLQDNSPQGCQILTHAMERSPDATYVLPHYLAGQCDERLDCPYVRNSRALAVTRDQVNHSNELFAGISTMHSALHFLWYAGIQKVILTGVSDGRDLEQSAAYWPITRDKSLQHIARKSNALAQAAYYRRVFATLHGMADLLGIQLVQG